MNNIYLYCRPSYPPSKNHSKTLLGQGHWVFSPQPWSHVVPMQGCAMSAKSSPKIFEQLLGQFSFPTRNSIVN